jgi:hypothetical protein
MSSEYLLVKIVDYLSNLRTEHIMAATLIHQGLEEDPEISKQELKTIVNKVVKIVQDSNNDIERSKKLNQIISQVSYGIFFCKIIIIMR